MLDPLYGGFCQCRSLSSLLERHGPDEEGKIPTKLSVSQEWQSRSSLVSCGILFHRWTMIVPRILAISYKVYFPANDIQPDEAGERKKYRTEGGGYIQTILIIWTMTAIVCAAHFFGPSLRVQRRLVRRWTLQCPETLMSLTVWGCCWLAESP